MYSFDAEDTAELTVAKGDTVVLVTPHDQLGSRHTSLLGHFTIVAMVTCRY